jgi:oxygen-independent coproporphyrinogen-3 oxidase
MFGVYIHFPYCRKRCPYCDFAVHARQKIPHDRYADVVVDELAVRAKQFAGRRVVSIYFGGGTPGLWRPDCIARVVAAVRARFDIDGDGAEITVEANPDDLPPAQLAGLRAAGVNRLSLGVQSFAPKHLAALGRLHGADEARAAVAHARAAGFDNLSLDLMFALPGQTMAELDADLDALLALAPEHLSIYNLTVEERTAFGALQRRGLLMLPDGGLAADMYQRVMARVAAAGLEHYEISSYARAGRRAVHNTLYWRGGEYLGLGCSAASFRRDGDGGERFSNVRSVDDYFAAQQTGHAPAEHERLDAAALDREALWLGLRLLDGIDRAAHARVHGADPVARHAREIQRLTEEGLLSITPERIRLTPRGVLFADEVAARFA